MKTIVYTAAIVAALTGQALAWDNTQSGPGPKQIVDQGGVGAQATARATSQATSGAFSNAAGGNARATGGNRIRACDAG